MLIILTAAAGLFACGLLVLRITSLLHLLTRLLRFLDDVTQSHQIYVIPQKQSDSDHHLNPLFRKSLAYVTSLPTLEDSDLVHVISPSRLHLGPGQTVSDSFRGARLTWTHNQDSLHLRLRRHDRHRVLRPYLQYVEAVADEIEVRKKEIKLFNSSSDGCCWKSVPFTHPASFDTVVMDSDVKNKIKSDLESFVKGRNYYARLGRVWKRSYLLHGPPGTGKSTFVVAMARFLCYDVYNLQLSKSKSADELKSLLLQTTAKSLILIENLDRYFVQNKEEVTCLLDFIDGVLSLEERVMVFTMSMSEEKKEAVDASVLFLRPGRMDVHVHFPLCDFAGFKTLASNYLGLKDHKLYPQVEEVFQNGACKLSPAEVGEIMIANRGSPSRAIKTVINAALHRSTTTSSSDNSVVVRRGMSESGSVISGGYNKMEEFEGCGGRTGLGFGKDVTVREIKKLYGLIRRSGSKREGTMSVEMAAAAAAAAAAANAAVVAGNGSSHGSEKDGLL